MLADSEKQLTSPSGAFTTASERLSAEAKRIAEEQEALDLRSDALKERLVKQFTAMVRAVSAFKATQSYMQQQNDMWTNAENRSEEHTSELQSLMRSSYAVFCLKKKTSSKTSTTTSRY